MYQIKRQLRHRPSRKNSFTQFISTIDSGHSFFVPLDDIAIMHYKNQKSFIGSIKSSAKTANKQVSIYSETENGISGYRIFIR